MVIDLAGMTSLLERLLAPLNQRGEIDVIVDHQAAELEVLTDDWTLHVDCRPNGLAWLAIDMEPESADEARTAIEEVVGPEVVRALNRADDELNKALSAALVASDDLLSMELAAAMSEARAARCERTDAIGESVGG